MQLYSLSVCQVGEAEEGWAAHYGSPRTATTLLRGAAATPRQLAYLANLLDAKCSDTRHQHNLACSQLQAAPAAAASRAQASVTCLITTVLFQTTLVVSNVLPVLQ